AGGLLGEFGQGELRDSYARAEVMGDGMAGGLLGLLNAGGAVADSYANVAVNGLLSGALIGAVTGGADGVSASFWNSAVVPDLDAAGYDELGLGFAGLAPAALRAEATFADAGWDLDAVWALHPSV